MKNPPLKGNIAGLDEAGRGSWAGPVVAAAVIIPRGTRLTGVDDSKKLTPKKRDILFEQITASCHYGIGQATHLEVDEHGLVYATYLAFQRALEALPLKPDHLYIDGNDKFPFELQKTSVVRGDQKFRCIAAASILAKVTRDRIMVNFAKSHPEYSFERHKGYGTDLHQKALKNLGVCELHRQTYEPIKAFLSSSKV